MPKEPVVFGGGLKVALRPQGADNSMKDDVIFVILVGAKNGDVVSATTRVGVLPNEHFLPGDGFNWGTKIIGILIGISSIPAFQPIIPALSPDRFS